MALRVLCIFLVSFLAVESFAQENAQKKLKEIEQSIKSQKKKLAEIKLYESSILDEIEKTNSELLSVETTLRRQKEKIQKTKSEIATLQRDISVLEKRLAGRKEWLKRKLRAVQKYGNIGDIILLLSSSDDIGLIMRRIEYLNRLASYERTLIEGFKTDLVILEKQKASYNELYARLKKEESDAKKTAELLSDKKKKKELTLASIKIEKATYERLLKELNEASRRLTEIIRRTEDEKVVSGEGFRGLKGRLNWPINGKIAVPYGKQKDPRFNSTIFRNGIYIKTSQTEKVRPVYSGKVVFAEWFKGYGQLVIVNHGEGYHTLYANLSEIFLNVGDIINQDTVIGRVGESAMLDSPSLYFEIRYKGKPLDPVQWLKRR